VVARPSAASRLSLMPLVGPSSFALNTAPPALTEAAPVTAPAEAACATPAGAGPRPTTRASERLARQRGSAEPSVPCNPATAATAAPALATGDLLGLGDLSGSLETALLESALLEGFLEEPLEEIDD
jgi:hypothetical protein